MASVHSEWVRRARKGYREKVGYEVEVIGLAQQLFVVMASSSDQNVERVAEKAIAAADAFFEVWRRK